MRVLITGAAGFIGTHLVEKFLKEGHFVIGIDNFVLGKKENVEKFKNNKNYDFKKIDVSDTEKFCSKLKHEKIDLICHLAANSDIQKGGINPQIDFDDTFLTTRSVLELMRISKIKFLFFSSTSAIYGDKKGVLMSENLGDLRPVSYYGSAKLASESLIYAYTYMNDFSTLIFRFPNVIGPNLTHGVIFDFVQKLKHNKNELEILGNGKQTKPYMYVIDLVDAIYKMAVSIPSGINIYNIGVNSSTDVNTIAKIVCDELGFNNVKFKYTGGDVGWKGDVPKFLFDLKKIHSTGWRASYTSDQAVIATVRNIKEQN